MKAVLNGVDEKGRFYIDEKEFIFTAEMADSLNELVVCGLLNEQWKITELGANFLELHASNRMRDLDLKRKKDETFNYICVNEPAIRRFVNRKKAKNSAKESGWIEWSTYFCPWCEGYHAKRLK